MSKGAGKTGKRGQRSPGGGKPGAQAAPSAPSAAVAGGEATGDTAGPGSYSGATSAAARYFRADPGRLKRIQSYTGSGYHAMNQMAIMGFDATAAKVGAAKAKETLARAQQLQRDLVNAPRWAGTVTRGLSLPRAMVDKMVERGEFFSKNFWSTTVSRSTSKGFSHERGPGEVAVRLTIRQVSGVAIQKVSLIKRESEVLIKAGTRFKVNSVRQRGGVFHITMTEVKR